MGRHTGRDQYLIKTFFVEFSFLSFYLSLHSTPAFFSSRGGGQGVSVLALFSKDLSLIPNEAYSFFL